MAGWLDEMIFNGPFQPKTLCHSMINLQGLMWQESYFWINIW